MEYSFKAFISYSLETDKETATRLRTALHQFGRRWYEFRAMRVFCDQTTLELAPELWPTIVKHLDSCEYLIYLASRSATRSHWVNRELQHWLETRGTNATRTIFIVVTDGTVQWDDRRADFDREASTSVPKALFGTFRNEPFFLDITSIADPMEFTIGSDRAKDAVATISSALLNRKKDELIGEDLEQRRYLAKIKRWGLMALIVLTVAAITAAGLAWRERDLKEAQRRLAVAREIAAQSSVELLRPAGLTQRALLLALYSIHVAPTPDGFRSWRASMDMLPRLQFQISLDHPTRGLAFSASGRYLVALEELGPPIVIDLRDRQSKVTLPSAEQVTCLAVSSKQDLVVTGSSHALRIWQLAHSLLIKSIPYDQGIASVQFSADGKFVAVVASDGTVDVLDTTQWARLNRLAQLGKIFAVAFNDSSPGELGVAGLSRTLLWSWRKGTIADLLRVGKPGIGKACFAETSGTRNLAIGILGGAFANPQQVCALDFSPSGNHLAVGTMSGAIVVFERSRGRWLQIASFRGRTREVQQLLFSQENLIFSRTLSSTIMICDLRTKEVARTIRADGLITAMHFSSDGELVTSSVDGAVRSWDAATGQPRLRADSEQSVADVAVHPTEPLIAFSDGSFNIQVRKLQAADSYTRFADQFLSQSYAVIHDRSHSLLAATGDPFEIRVWSYPEMGLLQSFYTTRGLSPPLAIAFSATSGMVAAESKNKVIIWNLHDGQKIRELSHGEANVYALAFDGRGQTLFSGGEDGVVTGWRVGDGQLTSQWQVGSPVWALAQHPSRDLLAVGCSGLSVIRTDHGGVSRLPGSVAQVTSLSFNSDGSLLAAGDVTGEVRILDPGLGGTRWVRQQGEEVRSIDFSKASNFLVSASGSITTLMRTAGQSSIRVWDVKTGDLRVQIDQNNILSGARFDSENRIVAGYGNEIQRWDWEENPLKELACSELSRNLTASEWESLEPGRTYLPVCVGIPPHFSALQGTINAAVSGRRDGSSSDLALASHASEAMKTATDDIVKNRAALELLSEAETLSSAESASGAMRGPDVLRARDLIRRARQLRPNLWIDGDLLNEVCWFGALQGFAKDVVELCNAAVAADPERGDWRDSRGVARALSGDIKGAVEDFDTFAETYNGSDAAVERKKWSKSLQRGVSPFTSQTLSDLLVRSWSRAKGVE